MPPCTKLSHSCLLISIQVFGNPNLSELYDVHVHTKPLFKARFHKPGISLNLGLARTYVCHCFHENNVKMLYFHKNNDKSSS